MTSMMKMWISFASMGFMFLAIITIYLSRYKLKKGVLRFITALIAYIMMIAGGLTMVYIVLSGPTN
ncbi:glucan phosphoethanolaminetransferase (alkaline phosphatase superfamily) [Bacillus pakistanensis]|uniref:Glucan phosphoethanolaminetransferase (Alkaline phosphatase superfamily) n=1 Tax=Rossellomorea pakistanensis TaxID=992288 RepID=A0ABS2N927_9BACI|nr:DUF2768 domain-containing protein [Bacillus pakistanensis]MBM7584358.1 glucan phosphoethanolaminetransferase (alkaline phosphatase superfamily) [Bacillus pakistanensis]